MYRRVIAVDFDGTLSLDTLYPYIGKPNKPLFSYLIDRKNKGDAIVLWSCREGTELYDAVDWCKEQGLEFDAVNQNPSFIPFYSRKVVADKYIDDHNYNLFDYQKDDNQGDTKIVMKEYEERNKDNE